MSNQNEGLTALVRSVRHNLKAQHSLDIPHSALRAALLQAQGEHPHAFAGKQGRVAELQKLVQEAPKFFHPGYDFDGEKLEWLQRAGLVPVPAAMEFAPLLYLGKDQNNGVDLVLSLDPQGHYVLPEEFVLKGKVLQMHATLPNITEYGIPDYLAEPAEALRPWGLRLSDEFCTSYLDTHDDTGDHAVLRLAVSESDWLAFVGGVYQEIPSLQADVAEWAGLHYRVNFYAELKSKQIDFVCRMLSSVNEEEFAELVLAGHFR